MHVVTCEGVPRDLGRDQGLAQRDAVRAAADRRLRARLGVAGAASRRWQRDVRHHFPHQAEWHEGLARAAGVSVASMLPAWRAALAADRQAVLLAVRTPEGVRLLRSAPPAGFLRRVRPEGRFASLELASPLLATAWVGVNACGLAVAVTGSPEMPGRCSASAALLVRDCLERFESVPSALDWCLGRPAGAGAALLLADARGEVAGVEFDTLERRVRRPDDGLLALAAGGRGAEIAKRWRDASPDAAGFEVALARALGAEAAARTVRVDVAQRQLQPHRDAEPLVLPEASEVPPVGPERAARDPQERS